MSFPRYPGYKESGVKWPGEVPRHWEVVRIRYLATVNPSKSEVSGWADDTLVSFLPMEAIGEDGSIRLDAERPLGELVAGYSYFRDGDVAFAKITPCFENGKGALMRGLRGGVGFGTTELTVLRPHIARIAAKYLFHLTRSAWFLRLGEGHMYGAGGQKRVPDDFARDFSAPVPPLLEQHAITVFLDRETARLDALVTEQARLIELLHEKRHGIISQAVTKGLDPSVPMKDSGVEWLGEVPAHWTTPPLYARYSQALGKMLDSSRITGEHLLPYLRNIDVRWDFINTDDLAEMDIKPDERDRYTVRRGDLLIVEGRELGRGAIWQGADGEVGFQKALHRLRPLSTRENVRFMLYTMAFANGTGVFFADQTPNEIPHLTGEELRRYRFPTPPIVEQEAIVQHLDRETGRIDALIAEAERAIALLQERRAALISAAVTGQIDVRNLAPEVTA